MKTKTNNVRIHKISAMYVLFTDLTFLQYASNPVRNALTTRSNFVNICIRGTPKASEVRVNGLSSQLILRRVLLNLPFPQRLIKGSHDTV